MSWRYTRSKRNKGTGLNASFFFGGFSAAGRLDLVEERPAPRQAEPITRREPGKATEMQPNRPGKGAA